MTNSISERFIFSKYALIIKGDSVCPKNEALFSKRAKLYKELGLKEKSLSEDDYKNYILKHYTLLKRPVLVLNEEIFIGNGSKVINSALTALLNEK